MHIKGEDAYVANGSHRRERIARIKLNDACTHRLCCAAAHNEHHARNGCPPPYHSTGKLLVKPAEQQIKLAGEYVIGRGKASAKGIDVAHHTRMHPYNSIEGKQGRHIND